jgi:ankyrin repeat protein
VQSLDRQLLFATYVAEKERVRSRCEWDARIISQGEIGSALHIAARRNDVDLLFAVRSCPGFDLEIRDQAGRTPLLVAAGEGNANTLDRLLLWGASVVTRSDSGSTALHHASGGRGNVERRPQIISALVAHHADVDVRDSGGWTALMVAAEAERDGPARTQIVQALLRARANPNLQLPEHYDHSLVALHFATKNGFAATIESLLQETQKLTPLTRTVLHL